MLDTLVFVFMSIRNTSNFCIYLEVSVFYSDCGCVSYLSIAFFHRKNPVRIFVELSTSYDTFNGFPFEVNSINVNVMRKPASTYVLCCNPHSLAEYRQQLNPQY